MPALFEFVYQLINKVMFSINKERNFGSFEISFLFYFYTF